MNNKVWSKNWFFLGFGLVAVAGVYSPISFQNLYQYSKSLIPSSFRNGTVNMWNSQFRISSLIISNDLKLSDVSSGGENIYLTLKQWLRNLSIFLFDDLLPYVKNHTRREIISHIKHYLRPIKSLFLTSKSNHLINSFNRRINKFAHLFANPKSYLYLVSMNRFYFEFRHELEKLNDNQMSELIDIFLENPDDVYRKVSEIMKYSEIYPYLRSKFEIEAMMDFVRGKNLEKLRVRLLSASISSRLGNMISSLSSFFANDKDLLDKLKDDSEEYFDKKLYSIFIDISNWLNNESKH